MEQFESTKSKERVKELGEVFTPENIVKDMMNLDGIRECSLNELDDTFLEPSCGTGNFLVEIIERKANLAAKLSKTNDEMRVNMLRAVCATYGVDIMPDNILESKRRMFEIIERVYNKFTGEELSKDRKYRKIIEYVLDRNILLGNTLENTMSAKVDKPKVGKKPNSSMAIAFAGKVGEPGTKELEFSEWKFEGEQVTRTSYLASTIDTVYAQYDTVHYMELASIKDIERELEL